MTTPEDIVKSTKKSANKLLRQELNRAASKYTTVSDDFTRQYGKVLEAMQKALKQEGETVTVEVDDKKAVFKRSTLENVLDLDKKASYNAISKVFKRLIPGLSEKFQLGHISASILTKDIEKSIQKLSNIPSSDALLIRELYKLLMASEEVDSIIDGTNLSMMEVYKILAKWDSQIKVEVQKEFKKEESSIQITLAWESKELNRLKGNMSTVLGSLHKKLLSGQIKTVLEGVKKVDLTNFRASPSFTALVLANLIKEEERIFLKNSNTKISSNTKLTRNDLKGRKVTDSLSVTSNIKKPKALKIPAIPAAKSIDTRKTPPSQVNLKRLIPIMNERLPLAVIKHMKFPSLVNRTGRFAQSTKIVDITRTTKGFPSIALTYDKRPYGVFQKGLGILPWATPARDPRIIIDRAIRDIAREYMQERFYTRHV